MKMSKTVAATYEKSQRELAEQARKAEMWAWLAEGIAGNRVNIACQYTTNRKGEPICESVIIYVPGLLGWVEHQRGETLAEAVEKAMAM